MMHGPSVWDFFGFGELRSCRFYTRTFNELSNAKQIALSCGFTLFRPEKGRYHQDPAQRERGIYGIGGFLAVTKEMRILWSPPYLSRSSAELCVGHLPCRSIGAYRTYYIMVLYVLYIYISLSSCGKDFKLRFRLSECIRVAGRWFAGFR